MAMLNISEYSIKHRSTLWFFLAIMLLGGIYAFLHMGKREDSTFIIKSAIVSCTYPGATPLEVESSIVEPLERELRGLSSLHKITSEAHFGYARLSVELDPATPPGLIPQLWDELRRKVDNIAPKLPEGIGDITIADDFGDVYGLYFALTSSDGYTWDEMRNHAKRIVNRLYAVSGVEKVLLHGEQSPEIEILITPAKLASFDLTPDEIVRTIKEQSSVMALGVRQAGEVEIELSENTAYSSIEEIENQLLRAADGKQYRLGDIATIRRGYREPASLILRVDGKEAIGIAVASDPEEDIVAVGDMVDKVIEEYRTELPIGMEVVALYPENIIAREANYDFIINLIESLAIVLLLIMITMGIRAGAIVGSSLLFAIGGTLLLMLVIGETLNRTSLAGFIIAMGMLVDNAIVVTDNTSQLIRQGTAKYYAAIEGATQPRMGLLAATFIAIISFLPLQLAPSSVAEIIRPLFIVIAISLLLSWILALTQTPAMSIDILRTNASNSPTERSRWFQPIVACLIRHKLITILSIVALFLVSLWAMGRMPQNFFPQLSKPLFRADILLPEGYDIEATDTRLQEMTAWLESQSEVKRVSTTAGGTPPRYYLASGSYANRPNYGNLLIELYSEAQTAEVEERFDKWVTANFPDVWLRSSLFKLSPVPDATIEVGFVGDNVDTLRRLTADMMRLMEQRNDTRNVRNSWGNRVAVWEPQYSQIKAQRLGVERSSMLRSLQIATSGLTIASLNDEDISLPIKLRATPTADNTLAALQLMPIFSTRGQSYTIEQATSLFDFGFQTSVIKRINGERVMKAQCDPERGVNTLALVDTLLRKAQKLRIPSGYRMQLYGEEENREESNQALAKYLPLTLLLIFVILLLLFNSYRDTLIILLTIPLIFMGVVAGLLLSGKLFDFFSLLGLLGLIGMNVKNAVILVARINELRTSGIEPAVAVVRAASDRFIPVVTASGTTVLGLTPLLFDPMFGSMAATIMGGLVVATILVLAVLPVIYSLFYRIRL